MAALMDLALDDIIKSNQKYEGRGRGRGRGARGSKTPAGAFRRVRSTSQKAAPYKKERPERDSSFDDDTVWEHDLFDDNQEEVMIEQEDVPVRGIETGTKVSVSNLEYSVSEESLKEVFERVGAVKKVKILFDRSGRSEGQGEITFVRKADALSALKKYNGVEFDGKPIKLNLIGSNLAIPVRGRRGSRGSTTGVLSRGTRKNVNPSNIVVQSSARGTARRVRIGGNRGGTRGRGRGSRRGELTEEQLNADLDNYNASSI